MSDGQQKNMALLLTGGGARASYQVGVMKAISEWYPRVHPSPFTIFCGTSAGAINATALACYASSFRLGVKKLAWLWGRLHTNTVFSATPGGMISYLGRQGFARLQSGCEQPPPFGLLNNRPLRELLNSVLNYRRLDNNIHHNHLKALAITAASYRRGISVTFFQGDGDIPPWSRAKSVGEQTLINTEHLLASSAIPLVFPASKIGNDFYGDGSIHQLAPLRPGLKLGAEKMLIIDMATKPQIKPGGKLPPPGLATLGGHLMDAIFSDTMAADLELLERTNDLIREIPDERAKELGLRTIDTCHLSPSIPLEDFVPDNYCKMPAASRVFMKFLGISPKEDASITSYLLFEPDYIKELMSLGYDDAHKNEQILRNFLHL